ncbi:MAG: SCO family protein [Planctomycetota bacterium]|nr:SCO family protein [Planctomycetota bacterium]
MSETATPDASAFGGASKALLALLFGLPVAFLILVALTRDGADSGKPAAPAVPEEKLPVMSEILDFRLTERGGREVALADLKGKVWVAGFFFTRCMGPCPALCRRMEALQEQFARHADVRLVSFTMDPEYDTPEVLKAFAEKYHADPERWWFLTGEEEAVRNVSRMSFKLAAENDAETIIHSDRLAVVDRQGRMRAAIVGDEDGALEKLVQAVERVLREAP